MAPDFGSISPVPLGRKGLESRPYGLLAQTGRASLRPSLSFRSRTSRPLPLAQPLIAIRTARPPASGVGWCTAPGVRPARRLAGSRRLYHLAAPGARYGDRQMWSDVLSTHPDGHSS